MKQPHEHKYTKAKYIRLDKAATNPAFTGMKKPILKLLVCDCGDELAKDLLDKIPERSVDAGN